MIIKNNRSVQKKVRSNKILKWAVLPILCVGLIAVLVVQPDREDDSTIDIDEADVTLISDAEHVEGDYFVLNSFNVGGAAYQTDEHAYQGSYSVKAQAPDQIYCFSYSVLGVNKGSTVMASVWVKNLAGSKGAIALAGLNQEEFYFQSSESVRKEGEWELLKVTAKIKKPLINNTVRIYCFNMSENPTYFDNLSFYITDQEVYNWAPDRIKLVIKEGEYKKLASKRKRALKEGVLVTDDDSWVKGAVMPKTEDDAKTKVKLRLKGDWLDHLKGDKWSFRVSTEAEKSWNRLKVFSLQDPKTRCYIKEWVLHQLFNHQDLLTTRYDFINVSINEEDKGLYAYEEHFVKQIPEYNLKREGPIVKFTEDGLWETRRQALKIGTEVVNPKENPDVKPFKEQKTKSSSALSQQFEIAQNLMFQYRYGLKKAKDIFDLDLLAKYYAIMDLTGGHHSIIWHNQRFYYNPVTSKLEPIGFDGYDEWGGTWIKQPFIGINHTSKRDRHEWHGRLFVDEDFVDKYYAYLEYYSTEDFIDDFLGTVREDLEKRRLYIQKQVPGYQYTTAYLYNRAKQIRLNILPNSNSLHTRTVSKTEIGLCNRDNIALYAIGAAESKKGTITKFDRKQLLFSQPDWKLPDFSHRVIIPDGAKYIVYKVPGLDKLYYTEINQWSIPTYDVPAQKLAPNLSIDHTAYEYDTLNNRVVFNGTVQLTEPIVIPENHYVLFEPGVSMDIINKAFILSYSAVKFSGNEENPIRVSSSDKTSNGIIVIQADKRSKINHTTFSNLNTLSYEGWNLTGAVTFYESDVDIAHSVFTENHCEDALNIIRSNFLFFKSTVSHTFSDGFDADFCTGEVNSGHFYKTGNDGIDFSTSKIQIKNTTILDVGDKGISIGEQGTSVIVNTKIDGAVIGVASKDLSQVTVKSIDLTNCGHGFAAYQKKPEYGGGSIYVEKYKASNLKKLHKILPGSFLKLIDQEIKGD